MKKLMIAAVAMAAGVAFADTGITSANTVGYTGKSVEQAKFNILSAQFDTVGKDTRDLNDLMTGLTGVDFGEGFTDIAPQVTVINAAGGYTTYYYINDADDGTSLVPGWADEGGYLVNAELNDGEAFWFKNPTEAAKPNVAGEVVSDTTADVACGTGFNLTANVYPMAVKLNTDAMTSADIVGVDFGEGFTALASQITVINAAGGYTTYYYINDADDGTSLVPGWADEGGYLVDDTIPVMAGFWTKGTTGAFTLTFKGITK